MMSPFVSVNAGVVITPAFQAKAPALFLSHLDALVNNDLCGHALQVSCFPLQVFEPLVEKCKKLNRAMRIGTNHGSLSARILSYYGDTPRGMVESAFEFANICRNLDYHNFLFSMKASNPLVMVQAYRLLAEEMYSNGWDYPLHLGVTEVREIVVQLIMQSEIVSKQWTEPLVL